MMKIEEQAINTHGTTSAPNRQLELADQQILEAARRTCQTYGTAGASMVMEAVAPVSFWSIELYTRCNRALEVLATKDDCLPH
jgi:uncharacterized membrane protein